MVEVEKQVMRANSKDEHSNGMTPSIKAHGVVVLLNSPDSNNEFISKQLLTVNDLSKIS